MAKYVAWKVAGEEDFVMEEGMLSTEMSEDRNNIHMMCHMLSSCKLAKISGEKTEEGFLMHELLESRVKDDPKANLIIEKLVKENERLEIERERMLAKQQMEKETKMYKVTVEYNHVSVYAWAEDKKDAPIVDRIIENLYERVEAAITFITKNLKKEVKKPEWLYLRTIEVKDCGEYLLKFHYDDPVHAHKDDFYSELTVTVWGNIDTGFQKAQLSGY